MDLVSVRLGEAPSTPRRVRLIGDVTYDDRPGEIEQYWFEVPEAYGHSLSLSGNPWITSLLPLAVTLGEPLRISASVDPVLYANLPKVMETWARWYRRRFRGIKPVPIEAPRKSSEPGPGPRSAAGFFSGGVDSFFMVLNNPAVTNLISVHGFDIPLRAPAEFERLRSRLASASEELGRELLDVSTNLRETRFEATRSRWGHIGHGCALAGVGLALEPRFHSVSIAGTHSDEARYPWGSHPDTDPLFSTSATRFLHEGAGIARSGKIAFLSRSPVAMRSLHVCWRDGSSENCGECRKCYQAMLHLELLGALPSPTLRKPDLGRLERLYLKSPTYEGYFREIQAKAQTAGRTDIAKMVGKCVRRSRRIRRLLKAVDWLGSHPRVSWRARRLRNRLLADRPAVKATP